MNGPNEDFQVPDNCRKVEIFPVSAEEGEEVNSDVLSKLGLAMGGFATCPEVKKGNDKRLVIDRYDQGPLSEYAKNALRNLHGDRTDIRILFS